MGRSFSATIVAAAVAVVIGGCKPRAEIDEVHGQPDGGGRQVGGERPDDGATTPDSWARLDPTGADFSAPSDAAPEMDSGPPADAGFPGDSGIPFDSGATAPTVMALVAVYEEPNASVSSMTANAGYQTVYAHPVSVLTGDILRVRGQVEMTNDYAQPVRGHIRLLADGNVIGVESSQNAISSGAHHMPLWMDGVVSAAEDHTSTVEVQYRAARSGASPTLLIENGYGHLIVEQYRSFPSLQAAQIAGAWLLSDLYSDVEENTAMFGGTFADRTLVYDVTTPVAPGDLIRLFAQGTSLWIGPPLEMHGQGIFLGTERIGSWATENTSWEIQTVPLWNDGVHRPSVSSLSTYSVSMHGVFGAGGGVPAGAGSLHAMRFVPASSVSGTGSGPQGLAESTMYAGTTVDEPLVSNSGWQVAEETVLFAESGDVVRIMGHLQLEYPSSFNLGISCQAKLRLSQNGLLMAESRVTSKYITRSLEVLPLRVELVSRVPALGPFDLAFLVACDRQDASPIVTRSGGRTFLLIDRFH